MPRTCVHGQGEARQVGKSQAFVVIPPVGWCLREDFLRTCLMINSNRRVRRGVERYDPEE